MKQSIKLNELRSEVKECANYCAQMKVLRLYSQNGCNALKVIFQGVDFDALLSCGAAFSSEMKIGEKYNTKYSADSKSKFAGCVVTRTRKFSLDLVLRFLKNHQEDLQAWVEKNTPKEYVAKKSSKK